MKTIFAILFFLLLIAGCIRPAVQPVITTLPAEVTTSTPVPPEPVIATVQRLDSARILVTYTGGPDADRLIELETTVITGKGSVHIQSMGSRLDTTPVQAGGSDIFQGPYTEPVHVLITGYFTNGTHRDVLDTWI